MQFFWGVLLCDLQQHPPAIEWVARHPRRSRVLSALLVFLGLTIASYPEQRPEWQPWSMALHRILVPILPKNPDFPRFSSAFGLELISLGIHFSPWLRDLLSGRYLLWLGRQSFAVYLLHGSMLRIVLAWMLYGVRMPEDTTNAKGEVVRGVLHYPGHPFLALCMLVWIPMVYGVAVLWTRYVDPWAARVTEQLINRVKLDATEKALLPATVKR